MAYLDHWVIYDHPADYPDHFVVRAWRIETGRDPLPGHTAHLADTLEEARELVPIQRLGLVRLERSPDDDATIVETWI